MRMVCETPFCVRWLSKIGAPSATRMRRIRAISTGAPTTSIMKIVRRDQSISLSERSKIRSPDEKKPGAAGIVFVGEGESVMIRRITPTENQTPEAQNLFSYFTKYWNTA